MGKINLSLKRAKTRPFARGKLDDVTRVVVICDQHDPIAAEFPTDLYLLEETEWVFVNDVIALRPYLQDNFRGLFVIAIPSAILPQWSDIIEFELQNFFKIYYYNTFITGDLNQFLFLEFDFLIAGVERKKHLRNLLIYLIENYWRKIPHTFIGLDTRNMTNLIRKILILFETSPNIDALSLGFMAKKLDIHKNRLQQELKQVLNINFNQLKKRILDYYEHSCSDKPYSP